MNLTNLDSLVHDFNAARQRESLDSMLVAVDAMRQEIQVMRVSKAVFALAAEDALNLADRFNPQCLKGQRVCMCCGGHFQPSATEHICPACAQFAEAQ